MSNFIEGMIKLFNAGVVAYIILALVGAGFIMFLWGFAWALLSGASN